MTAAELSERCEEDKAAVSRALDYLEREGYLEAPTKSPKRYKRPLVLTEKGKQAGDAIVSKIDQVLHEVDDSLTHDQREVFYQNLTAISNRLDVIAQKSAQL